MRKTIELPDELVTAVAEAARADGKTVDEIAGEALKNYLETRETTRELEDLGKWGQAHARCHQFKPSDVPRAIAEIRRGR